MALEKSIPLSTPVTIGSQEHHELVLTEATSAHIIDAQEESEKVVMTPDGPALVSSPALVGLNVLRRQVVSIGAIRGPVDLTIIKRLSPHDLNRVQAKADELDALAATKATEALKAMGERGRAGEQDSGDRTADLAPGG